MIYLFNNVVIFISYNQIRNKTLLLYKTKKIINPLRIVNNTLTYLQNLNTIIKLIPRICAYSSSLSNVKKGSSNDSSKTGF